jgi:hypothetical protein
MIILDAFFSDCLWSSSASGVLDGCLAQSSAVDSIVKPSKVANFLAEMYAAFMSSLIVPLQSNPYAFKVSGMTQQLRCLRTGTLLDIWML